MYCPPQFREDRTDVLYAAVRKIRLATLVTLSPGGLLATHLPMILKIESGTVRLEGHVARANGQWRESNFDVEALALFLGPHAYISPTFYETKREHQKVVPTWNYIAVHARGTLTAIENTEWLRRHLADLTDENESGRAEPWKVTDAPADFLEKLYPAVVGLSLEIRTLEGAWKMIQHRSDRDRLGTIEGLAASLDVNDQAVSGVMKDLEQQRQQAAR